VPDDRIGIGIIGLGAQGNAHLRALLACPEAEVMALCDPDAEALRLAELSARQGWAQPQLLSDYRELLDHAGVQAVIIAVPDDLHREVAVAAFQAGKDVLLEKPIAHTIEDADAILAAAEASGCLLQLGLVYRYSRHYRRMAAIAASGDIGKPQMAWCQEFRRPFQDVAWYHSQARTGSALNEKDCHHFDLFNWLLGSRAKRVCAFGSRAVLVPGGGYLERREPDGTPRYLDYGDNVDHAAVIIEYENGAIGQLNLCLFLSPATWSHEHYEVGLIGRNGRMVRSDLSRSLLVISGGQEFDERQEITVREAQGPRLPHPGAMFQEQEFLRCVRTREPPFASGQIAREASLIAFAAERSIQEGRVVALEEVDPQRRA